MQRFARNDRGELGLCALGLALILLAFLPSARVLDLIYRWALPGAVYFAILLPLGWAQRRFGKLQCATPGSSCSSGRNSGCCH